VCLVQQGTWRDSSRLPSRWAAAARPREARLPPRPVVPVSPGIEPAAPQTRPAAVGSLRGRSFQLHHLYLVASAIRPARCAGARTTAPGGAPRETRPPPPVGPATTG